MQFFFCVLVVLQRLDDLEGELAQLRSDHEAEVTKLTEEIQELEINLEGTSQMVKDFVINHQ